MAQLFVEGSSSACCFLRSSCSFSSFLRCAGRLAAGLVVFELVDAGGDLALKRNDVLGAHPGQRAFVVAVQVDEALEGPLLAAGEQPVDGPLLVDLQVVLVEPGGEVAADRFPGLLARSGRGCRR